MNMQLPAIGGPGSSKETVTKSRLTDALNVINSLPSQPDVDPATISSAKNIFNANPSQTQTSVHQIHRRKGLTSM